MVVKLSLTPVYGLENAHAHGRSLAVWMIEKGNIVKGVNPSLAFDQRKSEPMMKKMRMALVVHLEDTVKASRMTR